MNAYSDSVRFLYSLGNEVKTAKLGLERITRVLEELGHPHRRPGIVHVAGTNGKGSTCAMLEAALREAGFRTGLFTSPHLVEPTERIRINGRAVDAAEFAEAFERVHAASERLLAAERIDAHPTYFECVTAMAFLLFAGTTDRVVLEVGLGGRLDATNVVTPELSVITPVDLDHEAYLGRDLASIAGEKAGIIKPGVPVVLARQHEEARRVLLDRAQSLNAPVVEAGVAGDVELDERGSRFVWQGRQLRCALAGGHQVDNALTALAALEQWRVPAGAVARGLASVRWPGRLEWLDGAPPVLLDGAHNPAGTRTLAAYLARFAASRRITLIYGVMRDKAVEESIALLFPLAHELILTAPAQPRALRPEALAAMISHPAVRIAPNVGAALQMASGAEMVVVAGSLFLVGETRALLVQ